MYPMVYRHMRWRRTGSVARSPGGARRPGDSLPGLPAPHPSPALQILSETDRILKLLLPWWLQASGKARGQEELMPRLPSPLYRALRSTTPHPRAGVRVNLSTRWLVGGGASSPPGRLGFCCQMRGRSPAAPKTPLRWPASCHCFPSAEQRPTGHRHQK